NSTMDGVDTVDQMLSHFTCKRSSGRWPMAVFYDIVDMAALNAYAIHRKAIGEIDRCEFLIRLGESLTKPLIDKRVASPRFRLTAGLWISLKLIGFGDAGRRIFSNRQHSTEGRNRCLLCKNTSKRGNKQVLSVISVRCLCVKTIL